MEGEAEWERLLLDLDVIDSLCICQGCQEEPRNQDTVNTGIGVYKKDFRQKKTTANKTTWDGTEGMM